MKELNRYVTYKFAVEWYNIGIELGLEPNVLKIIEKDCDKQGIVPCFQRTLEKWLNSNNDTATWKNLEVALTNVNRASHEQNPVDDVYGKGNIKRRMAWKICAKFYCTNI